MFKKAQVSLELIIVVIFIIFFLFMFTNLSKITEHTIETNHIKTQQMTLAQSLNSLFKVSNDVVTLNNYSLKSNINDFGFEYSIPRIVVGSKILNCTIDINSDAITISNAHNRLIQTQITGLSLNSLDSSYRFYCGQTIICTKNNNFLNCS
jgi:hypothetical protein